MTEQRQSTFQKSADIMLGKKTNVLLVKDTVGKSKPSTRALPNDGFAFGKPELINRQPAEHVINEWRIFEKPTSHQREPRDFKKLNKMSVKDNMHTAPHQTAFRASNDARIPFGVINEKVLHLPPGSHSFGKPNRAQTPVSHILANNFGEEAGRQQQERYEVYNSMQRTMPHRLTAIRKTQAQMKLEQAVRDRLITEVLCSPRNKDAKAEFKLKRFTQVDPRTSTKRGDQPFYTVKSIGESLEVEMRGTGAATERIAAQI